MSSFSALACDEQLVRSNDVDMMRSDFGNNINKHNMFFKATLIKYPILFVSALHDLAEILTCLLGRSPHQVEDSPTLLGQI